MNSKSTDDLDAAWDSSEPSASAEADDAGSVTATPSSTPPSTDGLDDDWDVDIPSAPKLPAAFEPAKDKGVEGKPQQRRPSQATDAAAARPLPRSGVFTAQDKPGKQREKLQKAARARAAKTGEPRTARAKRRAAKKARRQRERLEAAKAANVAANPAQARAESERKAMQPRAKVGDVATTKKLLRRTPAGKKEAAGDRQARAEAKRTGRRGRRVVSPRTRQLGGIAVVLAVAIAVTLLILLAGGR